MTTLQELWDSCDQRPLPVRFDADNEEAREEVFLVLAKSVHTPAWFIAEDEQGNGTEIRGTDLCTLDLPKPNLVPHFQAIFKGAGEGPYSTSRDLYSSEEQARLSLGIDFVRLDDRAILLPESKKP